MQNIRDINKTDISRIICKDNAKNLTKFSLLNTYVRIILCEKRETIYYNNYMSVT